MWPACCLAAPLLSCDSSSCSRRARNPTATWAAPEHFSKLLQKSKNSPHVEPSPADMSPLQISVYWRLSLIFFFTSFLFFVDIFTAAKAAETCRHDNDTAAFFSQQGTLSPKVEVNQSEREEVLEEASDWSAELVAGDVSALKKKLNAFLKIWWGFQLLQAWIKINDVKPLVKNVL